jgi:1-acyl-sn-glycerol-3-phosphate acyltransferase
MMAEAAHGGARRDTLAVRAARLAFFALIVRPLVLVVLGLNVRRREALLAAGPAVIAANHNSHLDTLVLMSLYPMRTLGRLRPVGAADHFLRNRAVAWFTTQVLGMIPIEREPRAGEGDPLAGASAALQCGDILILFPEGTRGEPETLKAFKSGIAHLARRHSGVPFQPVYMHGLGKALPRGEAVLVPFFCDVFVGEPVKWSGDKASFMGHFAERMALLAAEGGFPPWE